MNASNKIVNIIKTRELETALKSAALAYENYPLFNYLLEKNSKADLIIQILSASVKAIKSESIGFSVGGKHQAVAIFIKPNYKGVPVFPFLLSGGAKLILKHSPQIIFRLLNYEKYAMKLKKRYSDQNCWYLYSLTVHPQYQHKGLASEVIRPILDFFDATGQSCYLETNKFCNVPMYEHLGFALLETGKIPGTSVAHYSMRRDSQNIFKCENSHSSL